MSRFSIALLLAIAILAAGGCAQTAQITYRRPAEIGSGTLRQVAVAELEGEGAADVRRAIELQIADVENLTAVDHALLEPTIQQAGHIPGDPAEAERLLRIARHNGVDALVVGEVVEYASTPNASQDPSDAVTRARVSLALRLIDVETGDALDERQVTRSYDRRRRSDRLLSSARADVMERLTDECVAEFMKLLAPHEATASVELANGELFRLSGLDIRRGVKRAARGDWDGAERIWRSVVAREPENHAALFNLAVAAASRHDYCAAEDYAMQALRSHHTDCYQAGLDQIRRFRSHEDRIDRNCDVPLTAHLD
ncbi:MAG: hypothetical protein DWQ34_22560 [Planctomycetota bacterium]|nr:MAG: hypothetical protein DWQ34_22560 [Planctomycetota bacterium]REK30665.1 MAG: hypothetical protein DWQ41_01585 [Planctomycetota bacterium]REK33039.1 MAG: hypothetical protein DWQ45_15685 [Planctomycetota bacterium]